MKFKLCICVLLSQRQTKHLTENIVSSDYNTVITDSTHNKNFIAFKNLSTEKISGFPNTAAATSGIFIAIMVT